MFNNDGDTIAFFASDGTLVDHYEYTKDPGTDISIGRTPDAVGEFQVLANATRGSANSSSKPTETPTPAPTEKPTKAPTATNTPTPPKSTKNSTTTTANTVSSITKPASVLAVITSSYANPKKSIISPTQIASIGAHPTSVLGTSTKAVKKTVKSPPKQVLVKAASSSLPQLLAMSVGGLLLVACGILMFLKKKGIWIWNNDS